MSHLNGAHTVKRNERGIMRLNEIIQGDALAILRSLPDESVQMCVTSPPYWGLRDYGVDGQMGLEETLEEYIEKMVVVCREVRRVLRSDGTFWCNMGDSYAGNGSRGGGDPTVGKRNLGETKYPPKPALGGLKPKDLVGLPWRVAFALQADGWWLRQDIIWSKSNPMPESVTDRCTRSHEYIFLLTKSAKYFYDYEAIKEPASQNSHPRGNGVNPKAVKMPGKNSRIFQDRDPQHSSARKIKQNESFSAAVKGLVERRNKRSVWTLATHPFPEAHYATFPPKLVRPMILAGSRPGDVVLDPFMGAGTTALVCEQLDRKWLGIELNPESIEIAERRLAKYTEQQKLGLA